MQTPRGTYRAILCLSVYDPFLLIPSATIMHRDKLDFYFREKLAWELKKDKILGIIRHDMKHKKR